MRKLDPGVAILGLFDDRRSRVPAVVEGCPVLGTLDDLSRYAATHLIDQIIITLPQQAASRRLACYEKLRHLPVDVRLSPDMPGLELEGRGVAEFAGIPMLRVYRSAADRLGLGGQGPRGPAPGGDGSAAGGTVMLGVAILIRLTSPGPVFSRQLRYGFDNRGSPCSSSAPCMSIAATARAEAHPLRNGAIRG